MAVPESSHEPHAPTGDPAPAPDSPAGVDRWNSKVGLILAMAGNAVGLGNFLRFPCKAAAGGGGAFMIPYFIALILLGIPLMWIEWGMGRFGGRHGHHSLPGTFARLWRNPLAKYIGTLGVLLPLLIVVYYNYIESWTLAYSYYSLTGRTAQVQSRAEMGAFHSGYTGSRGESHAARGVTEVIPGVGSVVRIPFGKTWGEGVYELDFSYRTLDDKPMSGRAAFVVSRGGELRAPAPAVPPEVRFLEPAPGEVRRDAPGTLEVGLTPYVRPETLSLTVNWRNTHHAGIGVAYGFFLLCFAINLWVIWRGVASGIELLAKVAMPMLFCFAVVIAVRVMTLPPIPGNPADWNVWNGLGFIWNPDFSKLADASIWLAAAGQIFFTLSICTGAIQTYASFLSDRDDVTLSGLTTAFTNEMTEIVLGGTIAIPAAVLFFGTLDTIEIARAGAFNLGFNAMPLIFGHIPLGWLFGAMWFALLFFAGITSSVALTYPAVCFLKNEMGWSHRRSVAFIGIYLFLASSFVIFTFHNGTLDEIDFWAGTFGLAVFGLIEIVLFLWVFGPDAAWREMHLGANLRIPAFFKPIMVYVTPLFLFALIVVWGYQDGVDVLLMRNVADENVPAVLGARLLILGSFLLFASLVRVAWSRREREVAHP